MADHERLLPRLPEGFRLAAIRNQAIGYAERLFQKVVKRFYPIVDVDLPGFFDETENERIVAVPSEYAGDLGDGA